MEPEGSALRFFYAFYFRRCIFPKWNMRRSDSLACFWSVFWPPHFCPWPRKAFSFISSLLVSIHGCVGWLPLLAIHSEVQRTIFWGKLDIRTILKNDWEVPNGLSALQTTLSAMAFGWACCHGFLSSVILWCSFSAISARPFGPYYLP